jgi:hypothetical protein
MREETVAMLRSLLVWGAALGSGLAGGRLAAQTAGRVEVVRLPAGDLQPQVVAAGDGVVHRLTFRGDPGAGDVWYARRGSDETEWSLPIQVNQQVGSSIATGTIRGPQLAVGPRGRVHVVWNGSARATPRGPGKYDAPLLYARMTDDQRGFEAERDLIGSAYVLDGGSSVAADRDGRVFVVWHAGSTGEEQRRVWMARSTDEGRTFEREVVIDPKAEGACGCCGLKAGADGSGTIHVLFRSARERKHRDMQLLQSRDHGQTFQTQTLALWQVDACPMSSETLAESEQEVAVAWETRGQIEFARINKRTGAVGKVEAAPGKGGQRRLPALTFNVRGELLLTWTEGTGWNRGGSAAWQVYGAAGERVGTPGREGDLPVWSFPAPVARRDGSFEILF